MTMTNLLITRRAKRLAIRSKAMDLLSQGVLVWHTHCQAFRSETDLPDYTKFSLQQLLCFKSNRNTIDSQDRLTHQKFIIAYI